MNALTKLLKTKDKLKTTRPERDSSIDAWLPKKSETRFDNLVLQEEGYSKFNFVQHEDKIDRGL